MKVTRKLQQGIRHLGRLGVLAAMVLTAGRAVNAADLPGAEEKKAKIGAGDLLHIEFPPEPRLSGQFTVADNGKLYLPTVEGIEIGSFDLNNKSILDAEQMLKERLVKYYMEPNVKIELVSSSVRTGPSVTLFGGVEEPGPHRHYEGMTMLDLLATGRGFRPGANFRNVGVIRNGVLKQYDLSKLVQGTDVSNNILMEPGDYVIIPTVDQQVLRVTVMGMVHMPGTYNLTDPANVATAIAAAQGTEGRARTKSVVVARFKEGKTQVMSVDLSAVLNRGYSDPGMFLQNNDLVFVPESSGTDIIRKVSDIMSLSLLRRTIMNDF